jgi:O-acetylhomoserine/O-acetylserine sulfhydrylase-like pyridoxal-dependent enzyme
MKDRVGSVRVIVDYSTIVAVIAKSRVIIVTDITIGSMILCATGTPVSTGISDIVGASRCRFLAVVTPTREGFCTALTP